MPTRQIVEEYMRCEQAERKELERLAEESISTLNSLLGFMNECSTEAVKQKNPHLITLGLYANVLEGCSQDVRDNIVSLTKLYHSCMLLELDSDSEFKKVARQTGGRGKEIIESFIERKPEDKTLKCMGLKTTFSPHFEYIQVDFDDDYLTDEEYSEVTDHRIMMAATNKGSCKNGC